MEPVTVLVVGGLLLYAWMNSGQAATVGNVAQRPKDTKGHVPVPEELEAIIVSADFEYEKDAQIRIEFDATVTFMEGYVLENPEVPENPVRDESILNKLTEIYNAFNELDGFLRTADALSNRIYELRLIVNGREGPQVYDPVPEDFQEPQLHAGCTILFDLDIAWRRLHGLDLSFLAGVIREDG